MAESDAHTSGQAHSKPGPDEELENATRTLLPTAEAEVQEDEDDGLELDARQSEEMRQIFGTTLPQYLQPVQEMIEQVLSGDGDTETLQALGGTLFSLRQASSRMGFHDICHLLESLEARLEQLQEDRDRLPAKETREGILGDMLELTDLAEQMAQTATQEPRARSDSLFRALHGAPGADGDVLRRLSTAGLMTVDQLRAADPREVAVVSGLELDLVQSLIRALEPAPVPPGEPTGDAGNPAGVAEGDSGPARSADGQDRDSGVLELPLQVEPLRAMSLRKLEQRLDLEGSIADLRAGISRLHAGMQQRQTELRVMLEGRDRAREALCRVVEQMSDSAASLDRARSRLEAVRTGYAASMESVRLAEERVMSLAEQRQLLASQDSGLVSQLRDLVEQVERIRRRVGGTGEGRG